LYNKLTK